MREICPPARAPSDRSRRASRAGEDLEMLRRELEAVLARCGLSPRRVRLAPLGLENKVELRGATLWVDDAYVLATYQHGVAEARAACLLYALHELIHVEQGIGAKSSVAALRRAGAEATLMHFDLEADHGAACLLRRARPAWSLPWLKRVQGEALAAFPATARHSAQAVLRKSRRLVALRLDWLARRRGVIRSDDEGAGYLFAEYGGGGPLLICRSGPPLGVVSLGEIGAATAARLDRAALPAAGLTLSQLDALLTDLLREAQRPPPCDLAAAG